MGVPVWVWGSSALYAGAGVYLWWRLVRGTTRPGTPPRWIGSVMIGFIAVAAPVALIAQFVMPMGFQRVVGWPGWISYAFIIFAGCTAVLAEPLRLVRRWEVRRRRPATSVDDPATTSPVADGTPPGTVSRRVVVERTRIALVSDLHVGSLTTRDDCRRIVDLVNAQNADIVCLAGDFSDGDAATLGADLAPLADLPSTEGTFFVTGNHEFYFDVDSWLQFFPSIGVRVLANEGVPLRGILLAGTHDVQGEEQGRGPDVARALHGRAAGMRSRTTSTCCCPVTPTADSSIRVSGSSGPPPGPCPATTPSGTPRPS